MRVLLLNCRITLQLLWITVCPAVSLAQTNGPLRVHPTNSRYFADASGHAVLLTGSHTWNNLIDIGPDDPPQPIDFDAYLRWLQAYGHNFTRGWTWEPTRWDTSAMKNVEWRNGHHFIVQQPYLRAGPGLALDGKPKFDLKQPNPDYLQRIRERLTKAREASIYVSVMLFEGFGVQYGKDSWSNHPMNPANNVNGVDGDKNGDGKGIEIHQLAKKRVTKVQEAYLRWLVTGLNEFDNLLYEVSNETHTSSTEYCLAEPGVSFVIFAPEGGEVEINLTETKSTFTTEWHEVNSGKISKTGTLSGGSKQFLKPPFQGPAVLFLHAVSR